MSTTPSAPSSIGSLVASRRRRRDGTATLIDPTSDEPGALRLAVRRSGERVIEGHAADPADPDRRFVVELLLDGVPDALARADLFVPGLDANGPDGPAIGDGCYGFVFALDPATLPFTAEIEVRLANGEHLPGSPIRLHEGEPFVLGNAVSGAVRWLGGLDIDGWVAGDAAPFPARIEARIDDATVTLGRADRWRTVQRGGETRAEPGFRLRLPDEWADGRLHTVDVLAAGRPLPGSPLPVLAFPDGLATMIEACAETEGERLRAERFDSWFPQVVPIREFERWEARFPPSVPALPAACRIAVAVVGEDGADASLGAPQLLTGVADWIGAVLPDRDGLFDVSDLRHFLLDEGADCGIVLLMRSGTLARPGGTERLVVALLSDTEARLAYSDALLGQPGGTDVPMALTAFDLERALEQGSMGNAFAMRREAALAGLAENAASLDQLFLGVLHDAARPSAHPHRHVPGFGFVLPPPGAGAAERVAEAARAHLSRLGVTAAVEPRPGLTLPAVRIARAGAAELTLVVDAGQGSVALVEGVLDALEATRRRRSFQLVVSASGLEDGLAQRLRLGGIVVQSAPAGLSHARRLGDAMTLVPGQAVALLDARLRPADEFWLEELLGRLADPGTGLVAPVLADRTGLVLEAGLALALGQAPAPRFLGCGPEDPGPGDLLRVAHQVAAVSPSALVTRQADFQAMGGFDAVLFPRFFGAADYALKLQALGRRVVVAPDSRLWRDAADIPLSPAELAARERETACLSARWPHAMAPDAFGNPLMSRGSRFADGLAWPPGDLAPRAASLRPACPLPPGWHGR